MIPLLSLILIAITLLFVLWQAWRSRQTPDASLILMAQMEEKHRAMLLDLNDGLNKLGDRLNNASVDTSERLRSAVAQELKETREAMLALQTAQTTSLSQTRETVLATLHKTLSEQGQSQQAQINDTMLKATTTLTQSIESLSKIVDGRLEQIGGKVSERLDEGFKKTNETFVSGASGDHRRSPKEN